MCAFSLNGTHEWTRNHHNTRTALEQNGTHLTQKPFNKPQHLVFSNVQFNKKTKQKRKQTSLKLLPIEKTNLWGKFWGHIFILWSSQPTPWCSPPPHDTPPTWSGGSSNHWGGWWSTWRDHGPNVTNEFYHGKVEILEMLRLVSKGFL